jgi:hypothetical protein
MKDLNEYTGYFADCYVLTDKRSKNFIHSFLDRFIPNRQENAEEYEVPQYADRPTVIYKTADQLIEHLVNNKNDVHTIYWTNTTQSDIRGAMCFFTNDGQLIVGLYCSTKSPDTTIENKYLEKLQEFCQSKSSYIAYEEPPPQNTLEFLEKVKTFYSAQT